MLQGLVKKLLLSKNLENIEILCKYQGFSSCFLIKEFLAWIESFASLTMFILFLVTLLISIN